MGTMSLTPIDRIEQMIFIVRGERIILDSDIARLYGVSTKRLNEQVKRNSGRFPQDFMFKLNNDEWMELVANCDRFKNLKHSTVLPNAFTEHGTVMLANILRSERAIDMSVYVVRAFIRLREIVSRNHELAKKMDELERTVATHDKAICSLFDAIKKLMSQPEPKRRRIGFRVGNQEE